jgi:hypothetical protein
VAVALLLGGRAARAEERALRATLRLEGEQVRARFSVASALTERFRRRVAGGLESRVIIETRLLDGEGETVGRGRRFCKLLYSLWDEQVYVSLDDEGRPRPRILTFPEVEPALAACVAPRGLPVGLAGALSLDGGYRLVVRVALNPVSEELVERSRQFVTNPRGGARGRPNAVLGAVAGLFGAEGGALGETFEFRSAALLRPRRTAATADTTETPTAAASVERTSP